MLELTHSFLDAPTLAKILALVQQHDFVDGKTTAKGLAAMAKNNLQAQPQEKLQNELERLVFPLLRTHPRIAGRIMPVRISRPMISRYTAGHNYGKHYDRPIMQTPGPLRTDFSATIFLSSNYQGGELLIYADGAEMKVKGQAGDIVLYPSGQLHEVLPVTSGERLVLVLWIQSLFRDEQIRQTVADLGEVHAKMRETDPAETKLLRAINTLTRKYGEP